MSKRVCAALMAVWLLVCLAACDSGTRDGQVLDSGWIVRGDADGVGEREEWHNGFTQANEVTADTVWYANTFASSLIKGERVMLSLCDLGAQATVWLNGRQVDVRDAAMGEFSIDVTDAVKSVGTNILVIRAGADAAVERTTLAVHAAVLVSQMTATCDGAGHVQLDITLDNAKKEVPVVLSAVLTDLSNGTVMTRMVLQTQAAQGMSHHRLTLSAPDAQVWDITNPYLYDLTVSVDGGTASKWWSDRTNARIGFKSWTAVEGGYALNGRPIQLQVADLEQAVLGTESAMREQVNQARAAGAVAVRPSGTPTQALLDYADAIGMLVITEQAGHHVSAVSVTEG